MLTHIDELLVLRKEEGHVSEGGALQVVAVAGHHLLEILILVRLSQV